MTSSELRASHPRFFLTYALAAIKFFSNLFLFAGDADEEFLNEASRDAGETKRQLIASLLVSTTNTLPQHSEIFHRINPVFAFNAGALQTRSWIEEISCRDKLIIISGEKESEKRISGRREYGGENIVVKSGLNVIPWEQAAALESIINKSI